jgi:hypothetical protein
VVRCNIENWEIMELTAPVIAVEGLFMYSVQLSWAMAVILRSVDVYHCIIFEVNILVVMIPVSKP